jgi:hypothetical protein
MAGWPITGRTRVWVHVAHPSAAVRAAQTLSQAFREQGPDGVGVSIDAAPDDMLPSSAA